MKKRPLEPARMLALAALFGWVTLSGCGDSTDKDAQMSAKWTRQAMIQACVNMHSCGVTRLDNVWNCIFDFEEKVATPSGQGPLYKKLHACVLEAKGSCDGVLACFGAGKWDATKDGKECDTKYKGGCDGTVRRYCETLDSRIYRIDCAEGGLVCSLDAYGNPFCSAGPCKTASKNDNTCNPDKTQHYTCNGSGLQIEQCDWLSLTCGKDRDNKIDCVGTGKECKG